MNVLLNTQKKIVKYTNIFKNDRCSLNDYFCMLNYQ